MTRTPVRGRGPRAAMLIAFGLAGSAAPALGGGFALQENSGSGLGNAYAGGAAAAQDASTVWSNPAGMARLGRGQVAGALNLIQPSLKFSNANSVAAAQQPLGNNGGNAGSLAAVPNLYFTMPVAPQWTAGIGLNAPFGLTSDYGEGWIGRFQGLKSEVKTINVNPAVSWQPLANLAVGAGLNYQYLDATFTSNANYSAALLAAAAANGIAPGSPLYNAIAQATPGLQSNVDVSGSDRAWGWNLGVLFDITPDHRIGVHYRSALKYTVSGQVTFANPALPALAPPLAAVVGQLAAGVNSHALYDSGAASRIKLPEIVNLSYFGRLNERWDLMADLQYTGWARSSSWPSRAATAARCNRPPRTSTTPGALPSASTIATTPAGCSAAAWPTTSRRCRTRSARCACPIPPRPGSPAARAARSTRSCGSTSAWPTCGCAAPPSTTSARATWACRRAP